MEQTTQERCAAKIGEPYHMTICGAPVEYVDIHGAIYRGEAMAVYTGWYHTASGFDHHAVPESWVR